MSFQKKLLYKYAMYNVLCLVTQSCLFVTPLTVSGQAPLSMGFLQIRILEWIDMPSSRGSSQPRDQTQVSCSVGGFFAIWATKEAHHLPCSCISVAPKSATLIFVKLFKSGFTIKLQDKIVNIQLNGIL